LPPAIETLNTYGTGNAALTTLTHVADPQQSLALRASNGSPGVHMLNLWAYVAAAADLTVHSPRMHDDIIAVEADAQATLATPLLDEGFTQDLYSQDILIIQSTFAVAPGNGIAENLGAVIYYDDLPGIKPRLAMPAQITPNVKGYLGVKFIATSSATAGAIGAGVAINATQDYFKANSDYALIGYNLRTIAANFAIQGADTGNLFIGGPGAVDPLVTRRWFWTMSESEGRPCIPVINSANKASTFFVVSHPTASTAVTGTAFFAYLGDTSNAY